VTNIVKTLSQIAPKWLLKWVKIRGPSKVTEGFKMCTLIYNKQIYNS